MTTADDPSQVNQTLIDFDAGCRLEWDTVDQPAPGDRLMTLNRVSTSVVKQMIPPAALEITAKMRSSAEFRSFVKEREEEIERGVTTPQRKKQIRRKMSRFRRKDFNKWYLRSVDKLNECVQNRR